MHEAFSRKRPKIATQLPYSLKKLLRSWRIQKVLCAEQSGVTKADLRSDSDAHMALNGQRVRHAIRKFLS